MGGGFGGAHMGGGFGGGHFGGGEGHRFAGRRGYGGGDYDYGCAYGNPYYNSCYTGSY
jgi:hypothetical protein